MGERYDHSFFYKFSEPGCLEKSGQVPTVLDTGFLDDTDFLGEPVLEAGLAFAADVAFALAVFETGLAFALGDAGFLVPVTDYVSVRTRISNPLTKL